VVRKRQQPEPAPAADSPPVSTPVQRSGKVRVVFVQAHHHAGQEYAAGDEFWATPEERELLARFGAIGES
jgi:hypothetical protein